MLRLSTSLVLFSVFPFSTKSPESVKSVLCEVRLLPKPLLGCYWGCRQTKSLTRLHTEMNEVPHPEIQTPGNLHMFLSNLWSGTARVEPSKTLLRVDADGSKPSFTMLVSSGTRSWCASEYGTMCDRQIAVEHHEPFSHINQPSIQGLLLNVQMQSYGINLNTFSPLHRSSIKTPVENVEY